jgi:hypothetical protein
MTKLYIGFYYVLFMCLSILNQLFFPGGLLAECQYNVQAS